MDQAGAGSPLPALRKGLESSVLFATGSADNLAYVYDVTNSEVPMSPPPDDAAITSCMP